MQWFRGRIRGWTRWTVCFEPVAAVNRLREQEGSLCSSGVESREWSMQAKWVGEVWCGRKNLKQTEKNEIKTGWQKLPTQHRSSQDVNITTVTGQTGKEWSEGPGMGGLPDIHKHKEEREKKNTQEKRKCCQDLFCPSPDGHSRSS